MCAALAAVSLTLPAAPNYDPLNWLMWGREIVHGRLDTRGGTVWKPLPVLVTTLLAPAGDAAAALWLLFTRAVALIALVGVYRVAARLGGVLAGLFAAGALALLDGAPTWFLSGTSEWLLAAAAVWAFDAVLAGQRRRALLLTAAVALIRPEGYPFLLAAAWWTARDMRSSDAAAASAGGARAARTLAVAVALSVPGLWVLPQWAGSGSPLAGSEVALNSPGAALTHGASHPWLVLMGRFERLVGHELLLLAAAAVWLALRAGARAAPLLALAGAAWLGLDAVLAELGYPALSRFLVPAAAITCILAGAGLAGVLAPLRRRAGALAVAPVALLAALPLAAHGVERLHSQAHAAGRAATIGQELRRDVARAGGAAGVRRCGAPRTGPYDVPLVVWTLDLEDHPAASRGVVILRRRGRGARELLPAPPGARSLARSPHWILLGTCRRRIRQPARGYSV
jgi:hypothetical protein